MGSQGWLATIAKVESSRFMKDHVSEKEHEIEGKLMSTSGLHIYMYTHTHVHILSHTCMYTHEHIKKSCNIWNVLVFPALEMRGQENPM